MSSFNFPQIIGNISAGLAALIFFLPLQHFLRDWARREASNDQWVTPALYLLIPMWLLLMVGLSCVTASGGFSWLRLSRPMLYTLTVASAIALAVVMFVFIALYVRPGFTPRGLYSPVIWLVPLATLLLIVLGLNQQLMPGLPTQWLLRPWTIFTALSLLGCLAFSGYWVATSGVSGIAQVVFRIANPGPSSGEKIAHIEKLDPSADFDELLRFADRDQPRQVREAASALLRSDSNFPARLSSELESGHVEPALSFLRDATLSPEEKARFARPARKALERWVDRMPAPNYTTKSHLRDLKRWGTEMFRVLPEKFAGTGVDFTADREYFKEKLEG